MTKSKFFSYKNKPLVRKDNVIYYGNMYEDVVAMLTVKTSHMLDDLSISDKIQVQLISTDPETPPQDMILKHSIRNGLFDALDIADVWIERYIKQS
ncbi:MAG: hypothetical protein K2I60_03915 [Oscillospiraceae bacterium]|nr:hypothetical protein [Oscillospiraceae bacterium]